MENNPQERGIGFLGLLSLLLIGLKLGGIIDWPWWKVFAPYCCSTILLLSIVLLIAIISVFGEDD